jgi:hypothetical protein
MTEILIQERQNNTGDTGEEPEKSIDDRIDEVMVSAGGNGKF